MTTKSPWVIICDIQHAVVEEQKNRVLKVHTMGQGSRKPAWPSLVNGLITQEGRSKSFVIHYGRIHV